MSSDAVIIFAVVLTIFFILFGIIGLILLVRDLFKRELSLGTILCGSLAAAIYFGAQLFAQSIWTLN